MKSELRNKLKCEFGKILNMNCVENCSGTPDFILAEFLVDCLEAFNTAVSNRTIWYTRDTDEIIQSKNTNIDKEKGD